MTFTPKPPPPIHKARRCVVCGEVIKPRRDGMCDPCRVKSCPCQCEHFSHADEGCRRRGVRKLRTAWGTFTLCTQCLDLGHMQIEDRMVRGERLEYDERVEPGDKGAGRWRKNKVIKRYLRAKRPETTDGGERVISYRTEASLAYQQALAADADAHVVAFLRGETIWAENWLWQHRPEVIQQLMAAQREHERRQKS